MSSEIDRETYDAILNGDLKRFGDVVNQFQANVRAYITVRIDDPVEAFDLTQEVFVTAHDKWDTYDPERPLSAWLLGIARILVMRYRSRRTSYLTGSSEELASLLDRELDSDTPVWQSPIFLHLEQCLSKMSDYYRRLIQLRYFEDKSNDEIQQILEKNRSAVTQGLTRAREQLRLCLDKALSSP